ERDGVRHALPHAVRVPECGAGTNLPCLRGRRDTTDFQIPRRAPASRPTESGEHHLGGRRSALRNPCRPLRERRRLPEILRGRRTAAGAALEERVSAELASREGNCSVTRTSSCYPPFPRAGVGNRLSSLTHGA